MKERAEAVLITKSSEYVFPDANLMGTVATPNKDFLKPVPKKASALLFYYLVMYLVDF